MGSDTGKFVAFYAWQSDLPDTTNRGAIRRSLRKAATKLEEKYPKRNLHIEIDEATRGEAGSPNIPLTILKKIESSDAFVCDVTPISRIDKTSAKATPNPNVIFELGYAVAHLGWSRVIMLFNESFGKFPDELPFDLDRHRASRYEVKTPKAGEKADCSGLDNLVVAALDSVIQNDPPRPSAGKAVDPEKIRRQRDIKTLRRVLETIHWPTVQMHVEDAPHLIRSQVFYFWEDFESVVRSPLFHLHDQTVEKLILKIHQLWGQTLSFDQHYIAGRSGNYIFHNPGDMPLNKDQRQAWDAIVEALRDLHETVGKLLGKIRKRYVEIDLDDTNKVAWLRFIGYEKSIESKFEKLSDKK